MTTELNAVLARRFSDEQLEEIEHAAEKEYIEMKLQEIRKAAGITQEQLAELMATKQSQLSRLERGEQDMHLSTLRKYVEALGGTLSLVAKVGDKEVHLKAV